jgi:phosphate transport system permease protein
MGSAGAAVTSMASSTRGRIVAVGHQDGTLRVFYVTTERLLAEDRIRSGEPLAAIRVTPKNDGILAVADSGVYRWAFNPKHPEASIKALFLPVWYEGYSSPETVWQSSAATDDFEPKLGLWPLIFGTLKATFYSMIFGAPLALLAAVFTSEFLAPRLKSRVKPTIELMASLPSVVLGFLAGLVFAPFIEDFIPHALVGFFTVPLAFLVGAYLWQMLPQRTAMLLNAWRFVFMVLVALPAGIGLAVLLGPAVEYLLFYGGDRPFVAGQAIKGWLDRQYGSAFGGWLLLLLPLSAVIVAVLIGRMVNPVLLSRSIHWSRLRTASVDFAKFGVGLLATLLLAAAGAQVLTLLGFDVRVSARVLEVNIAPMQTYIQRNALIVGVTMGFAIIPIIYTIAEDALSTVPDHLRLASLGAGATPWQTAVRIVIPTAMSGLFSALMIGLGRAVGETMIVLMAAGNTPVKDMNIFNGFRTLSANIAVEMPEAVKESTHYRTLFLAALALFVMTFLVNTVAEFIRQRFRRRAFEL